ncbi:hypothetical protein FOA52_012441 [Chlamydomonas sp. UWO 241]|nr:hypothetical protein FOA52_012441 [Chlamydomonas sp. UWO 241]
MLAAIDDEQYAALQEALLHETLAAIDDEQYAALQEELRCGAEHLIFSSCIGGFKWDTGRFDAFETMLAILRARLDHPGVAPEKLASIDADLKAFMECREPGQAERSEPASYPGDLLCSWSMFDGVPEPCAACDSKSFAPGGMQCCGAADLASCARPWA